MIKNLLIDFFVFCQILLFWLFAFLIMLPLRLLDRLLGTKLFHYVDRFTRSIAER